MRYKRSLFINTQSCVLCGKLQLMIRIESNTYVTASTIWGCIQKFPYWLPGARTSNVTALCH